MVEVKLQIINGPEVKKTIQFSNIVSLQEFIYNNKIYHELKDKGLDGSDWEKKLEYEEGYKPVLQILFNEEVEGDYLKNTFNSQTMAMMRGNDAPFNLNFIKGLSTTTILTLLKTIPHYQKKFLEDFPKKDFLGVLTNFPATGEYEQFKSSGRKRDELPAYMVTLLRLLVRLSEMSVEERNQFCKDLEGMERILGDGG